MTLSPERYLKTGGDPRTLADFATLRDELGKLTHPARPDVNWPRAETLCLSLFEHNGVDLQTIAWYTLVRTQRAGLQGLNEGLAILDALTTYQWGHFWPQASHARMEILNRLSQQVQQMLRALTPEYADLGALYQAEKHLTQLGVVLQRLELKHLSQMEALCTLLHTAIIRLENRENSTESDKALPAGITLPAGTIDNDPMTTAAVATVSEPVVRGRRGYITQPEPVHNVAVPAPVKPWKPFIAGMLTMLVLAGVTAWGWQSLHQPDSTQAQLMASLAPLPSTLSSAELQTLRQKHLAPEAVISQTQQQLTRLARLPPNWSIDYSRQLVHQVQVLWPEQAKPLVQQWQQQREAAALPLESLNGWHQGMTQLQQLTNRLNALDEQRGKYMTVSELKSAVFTIQQSFNNSIPAEEQLRRLSQAPEGQSLPAAQQSQTEMSLNALLNRYALTLMRPAQDTRLP